MGGYTDSRCRPVTFVRVPPTREHTINEHFCDSVSPSDSSALRTVAILICLFGGKGDLGFLSGDPLGVTRRRDLASGQSLLACVSPAAFAHN